MTSSVRNAYGYALSSLKAPSRVRNVVGYALVNPVTNPPVLGGDTDYRLSREELLYRLIIKSNPDAANLIPSAASLAFDTPTASIVPGRPQDTSTIVRGAVGSGLVNQQTLLYKRIDLTQLFKGRTLTLIVPWVSGNVLTKDEFIRLFAAQYGVQFHADDFSWSTTSNEYSTTYTVVNGSYCWKGSITVLTKRSKRNLADFVGDRKLNARNWPQAMIDFQNGSKPQGELMLYHIDYSVHRSEFLSWTANYVYNGVGGGIEVIVSRLNTLAPSLAGITFTTAKVGTQPGLDNIKLDRYALPNAAIPEANSAEYAWCLVLTPQQDAWFFGKIIVHFN
jgi:hypothetical protein